MIFDGMENFKLLDEDGEKTATDDQIQSSKLRAQKLRKRNIAILISSLIFLVFLVGWICLLIWEPGTSRIVGCINTIFVISQLSHTAFFFLNDCGK